MESYPIKASHSRKSHTAPKAGNNASNNAQDTDTALQRFKKAIEGDELSTRAYKKIINAATRVIEGLRDANTHPAPKASNESTEIAKIFQERKPS